MPLINYIGNRQECLGATAGFVRGNAPPAPPLSIEYLVVGGGSASQPASLNAGSGGGFLSGSASVTFTDVLTIEVGSGGIVNSETSSIGRASYISSSIIGSLLAGGGGSNQSGTPQSNLAGGGISGTGGAAGGGGAGAGQVGFSAGTDGVNPVYAGRGGNGLQWSDGNYYAGGGGGASSNPGIVNNAPGGEFGGGGTGAGNDPYPSSITASVNTGGGAGGQNGNGGSGIVIIRYATSSVVPPYDNTPSGGQRTVVGGYVYHTFTGSGQFFYQF